MIELGQLDKRHVEFGRDNRVMAISMDDLAESKKTQEQFLIS